MAHVQVKNWYITSYYIFLGIFRDIFLCFSLVRNSQKIFNTNVPPVAITSINGIRVISITWVILGHLFLVFLIGPYAGNIRYEFYAYQSTRLAQLYGVCNKKTL